MCPRIKILFFVLFLIIDIPLSSWTGTLDAPQEGDISSPVYVPRRNRKKNESDYYFRHKRKYMQYYDKGEYDTQAMLDVLRIAGVMEKPSSGSFQSGFRPFAVKFYSGRWRWPLRAGVVSSEFKWRWGRMHEGLDVAADRGVPVLASAPGQVLYAGNGLRGYGNVVILRHDQNTTSLYGHNQALAVKTGDPVQAGQVIAYLGSTGHSTGPHIHFEIRRLGHPMNPRSLLPRSRFYKT